MTDRKDLENEKKLADVLLDKGENITLNGKRYVLKPLKMRTRWYISSCINAMELAEKDTINLLEAMFTDIPLMAKIITYAILRDKEKIENEDSHEFQEVYENVMDVSNPQEYLDAITTIIKLMDIEWFFFIQETAKNINILPSKAGYREKVSQIKEEGYSQLPVITEK